MGDGVDWVQNAHMGTRVPYPGNPDQCVLNDDSYAHYADGQYQNGGVVGGGPYWSTDLDRAHYCGTPGHPLGASYRCSDITRMGHGPYTAAADFQCPKPLPTMVAGAMMDQTHQRFAAPDSATAQTRGEQLAGSYCNLFSEHDYNGTLNAINSTPLGADPGAFDGSALGSSSNGRVPPYVCFASGPSVMVTDTHMTGSSSVLDPGPSIYGSRTAVLSGTQVIVTQGSTTTIVPATGTAWVYVDASNRIVITDLDVTQPSGSSYTVSGYTMTNGRFVIETPWTGTFVPGGGSSNMTLDATTAVVDGVAQFNGSWESHRFATSGTITGSFDGTYLSVDVGYVIPLDSMYGGDINVTYQVRLQVSPRPTATITSISSLTAECQRLPNVTAGADFAVAGTVSPSGGTAYWVVGTPDGPQYVSGTSATLRLPLYRPVDPPSTVSFVVHDGPLANEDQRTVRVVDTTPPANGPPVFNFGCSPNSVPYPVDILCDASKFQVSDTCDPLAHAVVESILVRNRAGTLLQTISCSNKAPLVSDDPSLDFDVRWHSTDAWGNNSAQWTSRVTLVSDTVHSGCTSYYTASVLYNGPTTSVPSPRTDAMSVFDWSRSPNGATTLPSALGFLRASSATVQSGTTVITSGIGNDTPRRGSDTVGHGGLVIEEARTNLVTNSRSLTSGWYAGSSVTTTNNYAAGPDGQMLAGHSVVSSSGYSNYQYFGSLSGYYTASEWLRHPTSGSYQLFNETNTVVGAAAAGTATASYRRIDSTYNFAAASAFLVPADGRNHTSYGGIAATALDNITDLYQFEAGRFPTEAIITSGTAATRAGERLYIQTGSSVIDGGRLSLEVRLQAKGGWWEYTAPVRLWSVDANNYAELDPATGYITVKINGVTNTTSASPVWSRNDTIEIFLAAGGGLATVAEMRINQNGLWVGTITGSSLGTLSAAAKLDILCNTTTAQFTSWIHGVTAWKAGKRPNWTT